MKKIVILAFAISQLFSASTEKMTINKQAFSVVTDSYDVYDSKGTFVKFYKVEKDKSLTSVLRLTLNDVTGDCASKTLQDGAYEIKGSIITFYTFWDRKGRAYLDPYGAKIQKYRVDADGSLKELSSKVYVETSKRKYDKESGMEYLFHAPKNKAEQKKLDTYVKEVERQYKGQFIFGDESKELIKSVKEALQRKIKAAWKR